MMPNFRSVSVRTLVPGAVLKSPIVDPQNNRLKLLAEGTEITELFLQKLEQRGISHVKLSLRDLAVQCSFQSQGRGKKIPVSHDYVQSKIKNDHSEAVDRLIQAGESLEISDVAEPLSAQFTKPENCSYADGLQRQWAEDNDGRVNTLITFADNLDHSDSCDLGPLEQTCRQILKQILEDADALSCLGATPFESHYPTRHATHVATIAMVTGVEIGLGEAEVMDLGMGCLIHDMGMKQAGIEQFRTKSTITSRLLTRLADHPVHAVETAGKFGDQLSAQAKLVVYQIHERLDGTGYPRGYRGNQIHTLAKIAAVADTFVALLAPRPHRLGIQGYHVMKQMLDEMKAGKYDPSVVRALLQVTSLYPIGSCVQLTDGNVGRVIRSNGAKFDRPTIEMWNPRQLNQKPDILNLLHEPAISIAASLPSLQAAVGAA